MINKGHNKSFRQKQNIVYIWWSDFLDADTMQAAKWISKVVENFRRETKHAKTLTGKFPYFSHA